MWAISDGSSTIALVCIKRACQVGHNITVRRSANVNLTQPDQNTSTLNSLCQPQISQVLGNETTTILYYTRDKDRTALCCNSPQQEAWQLSIIEFNSDALRMNSMDTKAIAFIFNGGSSVLII